MKLGVVYVQSEIKRNNFSFCIGLFTVFISVFVGAFLPAINDKSAIVFVKLAENAVGENDMLLTISSSHSSVDPNGEEQDEEGSMATHNETMRYIYDNDWMFDLNEDNITAFMTANNITAQEINALLHSDINLPDDPNDLNALNMSAIIDLMESTGLSWDQIQVENKIAHILNCSTESAKS